MNRSRALPLLAFTFIAFTGAASAAETVAEFDGGIGSQPLRAEGLTNDVRGVDPGGRPWEIRRLKATVRNDRRKGPTIVVRGEGLILGGGNSIGTAAAPREVAATLFCGTDEAFNSASVQTTPSGDFVIKSPLASETGNMALPEPCGTPAAPAILLIRNAPGGVPGAWFAAGIPKGLDHDD